MKAILAAIVAFFTSIFSPQAQTSPSPAPPTPPAATPLPTPSYPRQTFTNGALKYSLLYPTNTSIHLSPSADTAWDDIYTLRIDSYPNTTVSMEVILNTDLMCDADGPTGSVSCKNTAVRPFTTQTGTTGFLVRRLKTITSTPQAGEYQDTAYVFPIRSSAAPAVILSVDHPTPENLRILTDTANYFSALP